MANPQPPSVGRVVHYHGSIDLEPSAAIITEVVNPAPSGFVDLVVFERSGFLFKGAVPFAEKPEPGCWTWPPRVGEAVRS